MFVYKKKKTKKKTQSLHPLTVHSQKSFTNSYIAFQEQLLGCKETTRASCWIGKWKNYKREKKSDLQEDNRSHFPFLFQFHKTLIEYPA